MSQPVLIVDDDEIAIMLLEGVLVEAGYEVLIAHNGQEALNILDERECQFVISDWVMEGMTGADLCRAIRSGQRDRYVYMILLTANDSAQSRLEGYAAGADDFVAKPFDAALLLSRLRVGERVVSLESADVTIFTLAKLAESRDPETGKHLERVQRYCRVLAQSAWGRGSYPGQIDAQFQRLIYETSPLHDIGKVAIPDSILLKPGKLSEAEFNIMKQHTILGAQTLAAALEKRPQARFLQLARDIAESHHERWDGTGYPYGKKGEEIPLAARIVTVADVYDALSSKRVYKASMPSDVVKDIIVEGKGTHFDPTLVELFLEVESQFIAIANEFAEEAEAETQIHETKIKWAA